MARDHRSRALRGWRRAWLARVAAELDEAEAIVAALIASGEAPCATAREVAALRALVTALSTANAA